MTTIKAMREKYPNPPYLGGKVVKTALGNKWKIYNRDIGYGSVLAECIEAIPGGEVYVGKTIFLDLETEVQEIS